MKKILLLSDTHSFLDPRVLGYAEAVDEIWHAGDIGSIEVTDALEKIKPLKVVYGNIDNARFEKAINQLSETYSYKTKPNAKLYFTDMYLPMGGFKLK